MSEIPIETQPGQEPEPQQSQPPAKQGRKKGMLVLVVAVIAIASVGAVWTVVHNNKSKTTLPSSPSATATAPVSISITSTSFSPATVNVTVGTTVTWINTDTSPHRVASDPFPTNDGLPGFDSEEALPANGTYSYKFEKTGTFTYHDQQNPYNIKGTVEVSSPQN